MVDYTTLATTAQRLISENGRSVTLRQLSAGPDDAAKPWRGTSTPRATPTASLDVSAVFVDPVGAASLGLKADQVDFVKRSEQIAVVASTSELLNYDELVDSDTTTWRVTGVHKLKPGGTTLLYYIGVKR